MICPYCKKEFSDKVCMIHMEYCKQKVSAVIEVDIVESIKEKYTVKELKEMCKEKGLKGYSRMNEADLVKLIQGSD